MNNVAYIALGSNLGDRFSFLKMAINLIGAHPSIDVIRTSSVYETDPVGLEEQDAFLNMVIKVKTKLNAFDLLAFIQKVEEENGRERIVKWGPRTLDLDILLYNNENMESEHLTIPHPRMHERAFVLTPLQEIDESILIPGRTAPLSHYINQSIDKEGVRVWKVINGEEAFVPIEN
ncbi:2-amino-4-hydroxy-6-hydroxymethyldihydropteridine diphosphokinase [Bacillus sp. HMF5848]|uniref:2-amino-4-hydroxy-6- hydroxymethyldihydropteridine diphosphokinase n=1 Tax=Bacillus sp. HMF5848 TaxID=2495421 RepID=UPI000F7B821D|nr:2-amino-4-hydroxy-6-hydroxymethyldihydropteridine diphosphokinase [Bacillus sp. HMF5848]RSK25512.1 2-amino-4-hydroxy-6-hydroxymethyldihydropteridine diphosphokinase [Bacillus sp. HMF5848]